MINNLIVNGCSYMEGYAKGGGHIDLAAQLGIAKADTLAIGGSANSRILRTTLKHSYQVAEPTLYVLGLTFVTRNELTIIGMNPEEEKTSFEGRWCNPQNQEFADRYDHFWNKSESEKYVKQRLMVDAYSLIDRTEDLMYRVLSAVADLTARGHRVLVFQQADDSYKQYLSYDRLQPFSTSKNIIDGFGWCAVIYQHEQGVAKAMPGNANYIGPQTVPEHIKHPAPGQHHILNKYLVEYINDRRIV